MNGVFYAGRNLNVELAWTRCRPEEPVISIFAHKQPLKKRPRTTFSNSHSNTNRYSISNTRSEHPQPLQAACVLWPSSTRSNTAQTPARLLEHLAERRAGCLGLKHLLEHRSNTRSRSKKCWSSFGSQGVSGYCSGVVRVIS